MDNNNPYDTSLKWTNFYSQPTENVRPYEAPYAYPLTPSYQQEKIRPRSAVRRLSKQEALERVHVLKGSIVVATLLGFGALSGLVASQIFATDTSTMPGQIQAPPAMHKQDHSGPFYHSEPSHAGGFFNQQGQGGYGFGQGNNSAPFSGSHTS